MRVFIGVIVAALLAAGAWWGYGRLQRDITHDVSVADVQAKVSTVFPLKKCAVVCIEFADPRVEMPAATDRVELATTLRASLGPLEFPGKARLSARPRYDAKAASVYLADIAIPEVSLAGVPDNVIALVKQHGPLLANVALAEQPIYRISDAGTLGEIAKRGLTDIRVVDGKLRLTFRVLNAP
jgi:hypothetical protein